MNIAVLVVAEAVKRTCGLRKYIVEPVGGIYFAKGFAEIHGSRGERPPSNHGVLQITTIALSIDEPEQFVLDERAPKITAELLLRPVIRVFASEVGARNVPI